jgi:integrase
METHQIREPWNKGKLVGQKPPLKPKDIWAIRIHLQNEHQVRDLAMFNLAIDSKLRGCDLVNLHVRDVTHGNQILPRAMVVQRKTQRPVQFELTEPTRSAVSAWVEKANLRPQHYLFPSRLEKSPHVSTRQYARIVHQWVAAIGLDSTVYGTHTMRRTKATLIYKRTKNLRAVQLLLGHSKLESTVRYLGMTHWKSRSRPRFSGGRVGRTLRFLMGVVRPLSGMMPYACSRPEADGWPAHIAVIRQAAIR